MYSYDLDNPRNVLCQVDDSAILKPPLERIGNRQIAQHRRRLHDLIGKRIVHNLVTGQVAVGKKCDDVVVVPIAVQDFEYSARRLVISSTALGDESTSVAFCPYWTPLDGIRSALYHNGPNRGILPFPQLSVQWAQRVVLRLDGPERPSRVQ